MIKIADVLAELSDIEERVWFIREVVDIDVTDEALRARLIIGESLFIQVFVSERTGRCHFSLVQGGQRIYGRDRERGAWHVHPAQDPGRHEPAPDAVPPRPLRQFVAEAEEILIDTGLL